MEVKDVKDARDGKEAGKMEAACHAAMAQIEEKDYTATLRQHGVEKILAYGIAFCGKRCCVLAKQVNM